MDSQVKHILLQEVKRQNTTIELIASENFASDDVMRLCGSVFTNKYAEGYPSKRYYNGCEYMDMIEELAIEELKKIYYCNHANVQPHVVQMQTQLCIKHFLNQAILFLEWT